MEMTNRQATETDRSLFAQSPADGGASPRQAVAKIEPRELVQSDSASMMAAIIAAAKDPDVDVTKFERMMAMSERLADRNAEQAFNMAMTAAQVDIHPIAADANNPSTQSKYASYLALDKALRPIYTKHGFSLSFDTGETALENVVKVLCYVSHNSGHSRTYHIDMAADGKGAKGGDVMTKTHATGAAMMYGQRYLLKAIFNIAVSKDDDGNSAGGDDGVISEEQATTIRELMAKDDMDVEKFCAFMKIEAIANVKKSDYNKAITAINDTSLRIAAKKKAAAK